jgi:hypothetical protein
MPPEKNDLRFAQRVKNLAIALADAPEKSGVEVPTTIEMVAAITFFVAGVNKHAPHFRETVIAALQAAEKLGAN